MKIGILGTRGIPNAYGGFEQFAQYLAQGLFKKGHEVSVYNSSTHPFKDQEWNGIRLIHCTDMEDRIGTAGQFFYDYNCIMDARKRDFDVLLQLGYTSNSVWHRLWPKQSVNIINMDGLEWKRSKYNWMTRQFLKKAEAWAAKNGDLLVADSIGIQTHISTKYNRNSLFIPYGADIPVEYDANHIRKWNLEPGKYHLLIARMEPENNVEMIIRGFKNSSRINPLVIVGSPKNKFGSYLLRTYASADVRFIGPVYVQPDVNNLRHFSSVYFHGHSVGGTNPSLLEAMACGCNISAHDNIFNQSVLGNNASYFSNSQDVTSIINQPFDQAVIEQRRKGNIEKIDRDYNWQTIIDAYEKMFEESLAKTKLMHQH